jgi:hypothetical protein
MQFRFVRSVACLALSSVGLGCPSRESIGASGVAILGAGVVNNPGNKSLRFDILKFGLDNFCREMLKGGAPLKLADDQPVIGRFFADSCQSQVVDDDARKSFIVQFTGRGYAWTNLTGRIGFSSRGLVEYAPDFQLHDGAMYVYFRPRMIDATAFQLLLIESAAARAGAAVAGVNPEELGRRIVDGQLRRGFTVIRYGKDGQTDFGMGVIAKGDRPFKPFQIETEDKRVLTNERTEVHAGQQDFVGALDVDDDDRALYLTLSLDGAQAIDVLLVPKAQGDAMLAGYIEKPGGTALGMPALLDEPLTGGQLWKRYVVVPKGRYYVILDNSVAAGRSAPPQTPLDDRAAKVDYLLMVGEKP